MFQTKEGKENGQPYLLTIHPECCDDVILSKEDEEEKEEVTQCHGTFPSPRAPSVLYETDPGMRQYRGGIHQVFCVLGSRNERKMKGVRGRMCV